MVGKSTVHCILHSDQRLKRTLIIIVCTYSGLSVRQEATHLRIHSPEHRRWETAPKRCAAATLHSTRTFSGSKTWTLLSYCPYLSTTPGQSRYSSLADAMKSSIVEKDKGVNLWGVAKMGTMFSPRRELCQPCALRRWYRLMVSLKSP